MTDRHACVIPGCRRTCKPSGFSEWICGKHWTAVPKSMRRAYARSKRRRDPFPIQDHLWRRCKRAALHEALFSPL